MSLQTPRITKNKIVVGLYKDFYSAYSVLRDLLESGFTPDQVGLVASERANSQWVEAEKASFDPEKANQTLRKALVGAGLGLLMGGIVGLVVSYSGAFIRPEISLTGWGALLVGMLGLVAGTVSKTGTTSGRGTLVEVKVSSELSENACRVLKRYGPLLLMYKTLPHTQENTRLTPVDDLSAETPQAWEEAVSVPFQTSPAKVR